MKVLLVSSSEPDIEAVERIFARGQHQLTVIDNISSATELLTNSQYNVVIAQWLIHNEAGEMLLAQAQQTSPTAIRLLLTESSDISSKFSHQSLVSPLSSAELVDVLESFSRSHNAITKKEIINAVAQVKTLPSPPKVYLQLNELLKKNNADAVRIAEVVMQDPALVAKVLQFANSPAIAKAGSKPIQSIPEAITKMGVETLSCIVMTAEMFSHRPDTSYIDIKKEQHHSFAVARFAASLVKPELRLNTLLAGLLHDIGKLVLFEINEKLTTKFFQLKQPHIDPILLEHKIFGTDHSQIGGYLLHKWNLPYKVIEGVVLHHSPKKLLGKQFGVAQAVYLANQLLLQAPIDKEFLLHFKLESSLEKLEQKAEKLLSL